VLVLSEGDYMKKSLRYIIGILVSVVVITAVVVPVTIIFLQKDKKLEIHHRDIS
jgi:hypothetical protein